ncbi:copper resistance protein CopC [Streptomyces sp. NPDC085946]|uniref:copper resistance CopC/CopD family protein n=1 Tax=Streptomyces sp. NPDC085946 TaxID=3365744 RepID=UPI0037D203A9
MLLGTVLVLFLLGGTGPASAHSALRSTDPGDRAVLPSAPRALTLTFTESVGLLDDSFRVYGPDGRRVRTGEPRHADGRSDTARATLPAGLAEGTFTVAWRVVSADSHPVSGAFTFSVGAPSPAPAAVPAAPAEHPVTGALHDTARLLAYLAAALLIGTAAFAALCRPPDPAPLRLPLLTGWWTLLATTAALVLLRAPYEAGTGPAAALDPAALGRTLTGRPGLALLARLVLLLVTAGFLLCLARRRTDPAAPPRAALATGGALAVGLALTWATAEHASAGIQVPPAIASSVLHLLAMAVWLGGLVALLALLRRSAPPPATVARFSRVAAAAVTVLVVTGVYQSWRGLGSWPALTATPYGRILLLKLAAVVALLLAASASRRWTGRAVREAAAPAVAETAVAETAVAETAVAETSDVEAAVARARVPEPVGGRGPQPVDGARAGAHGQPAEAPRTPDPRKPEDPQDPKDAENPKDAEVPKDPRNPPDHDARHSLRRSLRRSVLAEAAVGAVVLVATTALTGTPPGRAEAEAARAAAPSGLPGAVVATVPFDVGTPGGRGTVQITLDPGRTGDNGVQAVLLGPDGGLTTVPELRLSFTLPAREIGPIDARLTDRGGYWATNDLTLPMPGTWTMKATVRVSELDQVSVTRRVRIA